MANFTNILPSWTGRIASGFGLRGPVAGVSTASRIHKGLDLSAPEGTDVMAPSGPDVMSVTVVTKFGVITNGGYGVTLKTVMRDGTAVYTRYMDMSATSSISNLELNDPVPLDTCIGYVGGTTDPDTGRQISSGPHLHYQEMLLIDGRYVPVDPNLNWFGLSAGPAATPDAGTGKHIPGQAPDPTAQYRKAYGTDGTVWLLYDTGETFGYSQDMQQWSIPATDGGFTTITRNVFSFGTPQARFGAWTTTEYRPDGSSYLPGTRYLELVGDNPGNPFLDPATAQDYALATATGHTQAFTLYASGTSAVDQIIELALQGNSAKDRLYGEPKNTAVQSSQLWDLKCCAANDKKGRVAA